MLQTVIRASIDSARIAEPRYSITCPWPPPVPISAMTARITSFAVTPSASSPSIVTAIVANGCTRQRLGREDVLDLAGADAERQGAEGAVRGGVRVAADHRHAGLGQPQLRADDVHDALLDVAEAGAA